MEISPNIVNTCKRPARSNICCVFVTFHPEPTIREHLTRLLQQVDAVLVVDNGSDASEMQMLEEIAILPGVRLIANGANLGQASALSQGMQWAIDQGYSWLLTMDQDSLPYDNLVEGLTLALDACPDKDKVAVIGPNYLERNSQSPHFDPDDPTIRILHTRPPGAGPHAFVEPVTVITTGALLSLSASRRIGLMRDEFFIDHVDDEYCLRARAHGFAVLLSTAMLMEHVIGAPKYGDVLWKKHLVTTDASPTRRYYQTRNHIVLAREYLKTEREWVKWSFKIRRKEIILMLLLEQDRARKLWCVVRGAIDAIIGRMGKMRAKT